MAFALAIALHEIAAGFVPLGVAQPRPVREIIVRARVLQITPRATPAPAPRPTTVATPLQRIVARTAPITLRHPRVIAVVSQAARPRSLRTSAVFANSRPVWDLSGTRASTSALTAASGAAAGTGSAGTGSSQASAAGGQEPCGFVTFSDPHGSQFDPQTKGFWVDIRMSVHFADGSSQSMLLDYPWYYASETANPWSDRNLKDLGFPTRFQPPPATKLAAEPELVKYVVAHSTADGMTLLRDCPAQ